MIRTRVFNHIGESQGLKVAPEVHHPKEPKTCPPRRRWVKFSTSIAAAVAFGVAMAAILAVGVVPIRGQGAGTPAQGAPKITGILETGLTAAADITGITDGDGLTYSYNGTTLDTFTYQWISVDGLNESDISGADDSTYEMQADDVGKSLRLRVSFEDDASNTETLISAAAGPVGSAARYLVSNLGQRASLDLLPGDSSTALGTPQTAFIHTAQAFTTGGTAPTLTGVRLPYADWPSWDVEVSVHADSSGSPGSSLATLTNPAAIDRSTETFEDFTASPGLSLAADTTYWVVIEYNGGYNAGTASTSEEAAVSGWSIADGSQFKFTASGNYMSSTSINQMAILGSLPNVQATGSPTVQGTLEAGLLAYADTSGISDDNGLIGVSYRYQWIRVDGGVDADISGATASTYEMQAGDVGKTLKVRATFEDDDRNTESLTSSASSGVAAAPTNYQVKNLAQTDGADVVIPSRTSTNNHGIAYGQSFSTGDTSVANPSVRLPMAVDSGVTPRVAIHALTDSFDVGTRLATLTNPTGGIDNSTYTVETFSSSSLTLVRNTLYAVVIEKTSLPTGSIRLATTSSLVEDSETSSGWRVSDGIDVRTAGLALSGTWSYERGASLKMALLGDQPANVAATGAPEFAGTFEEDARGAATITNIQDGNGTTKIAQGLSYQWIIVDGGDESVIAGATGVTYLIASADVGKQLKVRASFSDDAGHSESLTSAASPTISAKTDYVLSNLGADASIFRFGTQAGLTHFAQPFRTGEYGATVSDLTYEVDVAAGTEVQASVYTDSSGTPGTLLFTFGADGGDDGVLGAGTDYWLVFDKATGSGEFGLGMTRTFDSDADSATSWAFTNVTYYYWNPSTAWFPYTALGDIAVRVRMRGSNNPPEFSAAAQTFTVRENSPTGSPVGTVTAPDPENDPITYSVGGADAAAFNGDFNLNPANGEIAVKPGATIDTTRNSAYAVTITATDPAGGTDTIDVTIDVAPEATIPAPPGSLSMTENADGTVSGPVTFRLTLGAEPTSPVTINMTVEAVTPAQETGKSWTDPDIAVTSSVTLDENNYSTGEVVSIALTADSDAEDDVARVTYSVAQTGGDMEYDGAGISRTTVTITDAQQATVQFRVSGQTQWLDRIPNLQIADDDMTGGTVDLEIRLSHQPLGEVVVDMTEPPSSGISSTGLPVTFFPAAWSAAQTKTIALAYAGDDNSFGETYTLDFSFESMKGYGEGTVADHTLTVQDNDPVGWKGYPGYVDGVNDNPAVGIVNEAGGRFQYTIVPLSRPSSRDGSGASVRMIIREDDDTKIDHNFSESSLQPLQPGNYTAGLLVSVTAEQDDDGVNDVVVLRHEFNSGGPGARGDYHGSTITEVTITVVDDDTPEVLFEDLTSGALTITENTDDTPATKVFKVKLATEPRSQVTVTVVDPTDNSLVTASPETLTFNSSNWRTAQDVTVTAAPDRNTSDETATITFSVTQTGTAPDEYEGLTVPDVVVTVTDPDKADVVLSDAEISVTEESTATYDVQLSHQPPSGQTLTVEIVVTGPSGATLVTLDKSSLTFNSGNWDFGQAVIVTGVADANLVNEEFTLTHTVSGTDAGSATPTLKVTRNDNDTPNLDLTSSSVATVEDSSGTFDLDLTQQPSADVTVTVQPVGSNHDLTISTSNCSSAAASADFTFSTTTWNTAQTVTVCAAHDYDAQDDSAELNFTVASTDTSYQGLSFANSTVTVTDDDTESVEISGTALSITEGDGTVATATYDVSLTAAPSGGNVTVTIAVPNNADVTTNPAVLTFRPSDWASPVPLGTPTVTKSVEVRVDDDDGAGDDTADITHTLGGVSYAGGQTIPGITVTVTDSDTRGVTITPAAVQFNEGATSTYTVVLDTEPTGQVTITIDDGDANDEVTVNQTALQFDIDNWDTAQTATVSADADADAANDTATITHTVSGADYGANSVTAGDVDVTVSDLNVRGVILQVGGVENPTNPAFSIGEGFGQVEYFIKLATKPINTDGTDGAVTVTTTTSNTNELAVVDPETAQNVATYDVEFDANNWNEFQRVAVAAPAEDDDALQDIVTITHAVSGSDYGANSVTADPIQVTINDDDAPSFSTSGESLIITEGTSGAYTVVLDTLPVGGDVTITITVGPNPDIRLVDPLNNAVAELQLVFTPTDWDMAQTVRVKVAEDRDALADTGTIRHSATGANFTGIVDDVVMRVDVQDTTVAGVTIGPASLTVTEGLIGTYEVTLQSEPQSDVTVVLSSSNSPKASVAPTRLRFSSFNWDLPQEVVVTGVRDADGNNESATISHTSSGSIYEDVEIDDVMVTVVEDGTAITADSSFLRSSSCEREVRLTWNSPTNEGVTVDSYRIQWRTMGEQFSDPQSVVAAADATSFTLPPLANGEAYTIRVMALDADGEPVWSRETNALPSSTACILNVRFGNILADSAPVIVEVGRPEADTRVNVRYRLLGSATWSDAQTKVVGRGQSVVIFDIRGLNPDTEYEVQTWLGRGAPPSDDRPASAELDSAQAIFRTTSLPDGVAFFSGGGGGSVARILRIEPSIRSVTLSAGDEVSLSVEVWGRQGLLDNGLADKAPSDGRPEIVWSSSGDGTFAEGRVRAEWRDGVANDREVTFVAPDEPGTVTVTASLADSAECLAQQEDETPEDHEVRCSAEIEVTVVRRATAPIIVTAPVNPAGAIPETLSDADGVAYAVIAPVDGGSFLGDGYSLVAGAGAVSNGEYIGVSMTPAGDASNVGMTWHRYTLGGLRYAISVVDADGEAVSDYALSDAATTCVPLPPELRGSIADIVMAVTEDGGGMTVLSTSVKITPDGVSVCGKLSTLPATVAAGKVGSPPEVVDPSEDVAEEPLPDTGGAAPSTPWMLYLMLTGMFVTAAGLTAMRRGRAFGLGGGRARRDGAVGMAGADHVGAGYRRAHKEQSNDGSVTIRDAENDMTETPKPE